MTLQELLPQDSIKWEQAKTYGKVTFVPVVGNLASLKTDPKLQVATEKTSDILISELEPESVNEVYIQSSYDFPLLVINGTILEGGRQTRTAIRPFILKKTATKLKIPVNCVEQGRWEYSEKYRVSDDAKQFKFSGKRVSRKMKASFASFGHTQSSTWSAIEQMQQSNDIARDAVNTSNYLEVEQAVIEKSNEKVKEIKAQILGVFSLSDQRGILIYEAGELSSIEIFNSSDHWKKVSNSVMDSNITDLLQEKDHQEFKKQKELDIKKTVSETVEPIGDEKAYFLKYEGLEGWGVSLAKNPVYVSLHKPEVMKMSLRNSDYPEQVQYQSNQVIE